MDPSERYRALVAALEVMEGGVRVTDAQGRVLHENGALRQQLGDASPALEEAITDVRQAALAGATHHRSSAPDNGGDWRARRVTVQLRTDSSQYDVEGIAVATEGAAGAAEWLFVVVVRDRPVERLSPEALRAAYGLTARELRVALLLDGGVRSRELAETLGISVHTARRHVESVLRKLGVHSRAEVRQRLNG